jgi:hypothetical protein
VGAFIYALATGQVRQENKMVLGVVFTFIFIISIFNILASFHKRTPGWIFIFFCIWLVENMIAIIIIIGVCTILDELIAEPMYKKYKARYVFNKEYDRRTFIENRYNPPTEG